MVERGGKSRRGLEPGDDVLTTCKATNTHSSQRYLLAAEDLPCFVPDVLRKFPKI